MNAPIPRNKCCNDLVTYMNRRKDYAANWRQVTPQVAAQRANDGHPTFGLMSNKNGHGHIAIVRPGLYSERDGPRCVQAGGTCRSNASACQCFGSNFASTVKWWTFNDKGGNNYHHINVDQKEKPVIIIINPNEFEPVIVYYVGEGKTFPFRYVIDPGSNFSTAYCRQMFLIRRNNGGYQYHQLSNGHFPLSNEGMIIDGVNKAWNNGELPPAANDMIESARLKHPRYVLQNAWHESENNSKSEICIIQECLTATGYLNINDMVIEYGVFGERTKQAVIDLQQKNQLQIKNPGSIGSFTRNALIHEVELLALPERNIPDVDPTVDEVKLLQRALLALGVMKPNEINEEWSTFGAYTKQALKRFQLHANLRMQNPGTYGQNTRNALRRFIQNQYGISDPKANTIQTLPIPQLPAAGNAIPFADDFSAAVQLQCFATTYSHNESTCDPETLEGLTSTDKGDYHGLRHLGQKKGAFRYATPGVVGVAAVAPKEIPYGSIVEWTSGNILLRFVCIDTGYDVKNRRAAINGGYPHLPVIDFFVNSENWENNNFPQTGPVQFVCSGITAPLSLISVLITKTSFLMSKEKRIVFVSFVCLFVS